MAKQAQTQQQEPQEPEVSTNETLVLEQMQARLAELERQNVLLQEMTEAAQLEREQRAEAGEDDELGIELLFDPYDAHNALAIKQIEVGPGQYAEAIVPPDDEFPEGQVLGWKDPESRKKTGWKGWIPFRFGDEYTGENGELLSNYIIDPPQRMEGEANIDRYVRRMGMVLARLDARIAKARAYKRRAKSDIQAGKAANASHQFDRDGVQLYGEGLKDQKSPRGGYRMGETAMGYSPKTGIAHRGSVPLHPDSE